jgi:hypothetical protein
MNVTIRLPLMREQIPIKGSGFLIALFHDADPYELHRGVLSRSIGIRKPRGVSTLRFASSNRYFPRFLRRTACWVAAASRRRETSGAKSFSRPRHPIGVLNSVGRESTQCHAPGSAHSLSLSGMQSTTSTVPTSAPPVRSSG